jgi:hypothetical protein
MRWLGWLMNLGLRGAMALVITDALRRPNDRRYAGKGIGTRSLTMVPASLLVPAVYASRRGRWSGYPVWTDNLYLSIFALDLAGNYLDLYDRYRYFDAIPHAHGTGAFTVAVAELADQPPMGAVGIAQLLHIGLEAQEYYSDVWFDLHNVRGTWDTVNDLLAGAVGSAVYAGLHRLLRRR